MCRTNHTNRHRVCTGDSLFIVPLWKLWFERVPKAYAWGALSNEWWPVIITLGSLKSARGCRRWAVGLKYVLTAYIAFHHLLAAPSSLGPNKQAHKSDFKHLFTPPYHESTHSSINILWPRYHLYTSVFVRVTPTWL